MARLILHDWDLAEDAVQDAFVDASGSPPGLRDPDRFRHGTDLLQMTNTPNDSEFVPDWGVDAH